MRYVVRPISDRTPFGGRRKASPFRAGWSSTVEVFDREFRAVSARDIVFELDVTESDLRIDGLLRANARPSSPAIRIAFESKHGPLVYATDRFCSWQDNARAIALTLQALRRIDDYEVVKRGEQYAGFKALPAGRPMGPAAMTEREAEELIGRLTGEVAWRTEDNPRLIRRAKAAAHPDRNDGDRTLWDQVEQASAVLGVAS